MKKRFVKTGMTAFACALLLGMGMTAQAKEEPLIKGGIYVGNVDIGNMTEAEAVEAVESYVEKIGSSVITLEAANGGQVQVTAADLGFTNY